MTTPDFLDSLIQAGKIQEARAAIQKIVKPPPSERALLASLAARLGLPALGLKWLRKAVRGSGRAKPSATAAEKSEYALCLLRVGAVQEASRLLATIDESEVPQAIFYKAVAQVGNWEHAAAVPLLERYVANPGISTYRRLVGNLNLAGSLIFAARYDEGEVLLSSVMKTCMREQHLLLLSNCFEAMAGLHIYRRNFAEAEAHLENAESQLRDKPIFDSLFVQKWRAIVEMARGNFEAAGTFRKTAREIRHWESIRECDRFEAVMSQNPNLLWKVYFGTPYLFYRRRLLQDYGSAPPVPAKFEWQLKGKPSRAYDLLWDPSFRPRLRHGVLHQLLVALSSDFYRPFRLATLHEQLFPAQSFDPESSTKRLYAQILLLRKWFRDQGLPLDIEHVEETYRLQSDEPFALTTIVFETKSNDLPTPLTLLETSMGDEVFSAKKAAQATGVAERTIFRLLVDQVESGRIVRLGKGSKTRYRFSK